jgi:hypothetical protein
MICIAASSEMDPGVAHFGREGTRPRPSAGHRGAAIGVVEDQRRAEAPLLRWRSGPRVPPPGEGFDAQ